MALPHAASGHTGSTEVSSCHFTLLGACMLLGSVLYAWAACWRQGWAVGKGEGGGLAPLGVAGWRTSAAPNRAHAHGDTNALSIGASGKRPAPRFNQPFPDTSPQNSSPKVYL